MFNCTWRFQSKWYSSIFMSVYHIFSLWERKLFFRFFLYSIRNRKKGASQPLCDVSFSLCHSCVVCVAFVPVCARQINEKKTCIVYFVWLAIIDKCHIDVMCDCKGTHKPFFSISILFIYSHDVFALIFLKVLRRQRKYWNYCCVFSKYCNNIFDSLQNLHMECNRLY